MTKRKIESLAKRIYKQRPWHYITEIRQILTDLNAKGMLHPPRDDTFFWDKETVEEEFPNVVKEIRREEREKVINEFTWLIDDMKRRMNEDEIRKRS